MVCWLRAARLGCRRLDALGAELPTDSFRASCVPASLAAALRRSQEPPSLNESKKKDGRELLT